MKPEKSGPLAGFSSKAAENLTKPQAFELSFESFAATKTALKARTEPYFLDKRNLSEGLFFVSGALVKAVFH